MTMLMQWALRRRMMAALGSGIDVSALSITYTGAHTDYGMVTMSDGARYRLLAFTSSGTLSIEQPINCEVCVVGGGANGNNFNSGAGAYLKNQVIEALEGGAVVVGAAQGASSVGEVSVAAVSGKNGGTGAGCGYREYNSPGSGDGISKYPFGDINYSLWSGKPHCGAGSGGSKCAMGCNKCNYKLRICRIKKTREKGYTALYILACRQLERIYKWNSLINHAWAFEPILA